MATAAVKKKLLYKIAKAYYEDGLTQGEIGKRLGLSRIKISRLPQQARDERIVQITVIPPYESKVDLEREIEAKYGLDEVVIVSPTSYDKAVIARELGPAAADCLLRSLPGDEVLALSWGTTLLAVVDALPAQNWPDMKVVQILGGLGRPEAETHGTDLTCRMAEAFGCRPRLLPAPGIVSSKLVKDALMADPQIADTLTLAAQADIALVGIGRPTPDSVVLLIQEDRHFYRAPVTQGHEFAGIACKVGKNPRAKNVDDVQFKVEYCAICVDEVKVYEMSGPPTTPP